MLFGLPLSLSLDNVLLGAGVSAAPGPALLSALGIGAISAAMSCIGLYCGGWLRQAVPERIELVAGAYLCMLAVRMFIADGI
jgi:putative Mn2+ efflux pump MntP